MEATCSGQRGLDPPSAIDFSLHQERGSYDKHAIRKKEPHPIMSDKSGSDGSSSARERETGMH
jgi:hypothetical protein